MLPTHASSSATELTAPSPGRCPHARDKRGFHESSFPSTVYPWGCRRSERGEIRLADHDENLYTVPSDILCRSTRKPPLSRSLTSSSPTGNMTCGSRRCGPFRRGHARCRCDPMNGDGPHRRIRDQCRCHRVLWLQVAQGDVGPLSDSSPPRLSNSEPRADGIQEQFGYLGPEGG